MNKTTFTFAIFSLTMLISCNSIDFTNPEEVITSFRRLTKENKNENLYENFLSSKSKEFVTKDEFIKTRNIPDSNIKSNNPLNRKVYTLPLDATNPTYRRFKVDEQQIVDKDTIYNRIYYTLINEDSKWKVIWTGTLKSFASEKYEAGNYTEARKTLEKILEIDPFYGDAYQLLAWCYYRDQSLTRKDWEDGVVKNAKYALSLEEDNPFNYNVLAAYYTECGNYDLAIQNFERGLSYCQNKIDKAPFYSNLVGSYMAIKNYEKAEEYIKKSIAINDKDAFVWFKYGALMLALNNIDEATKHFERALNLDKMENPLQGGLYYGYAYCSFYKGNCNVAREYINKALDIEPNNYIYQDLYNNLKFCNSRSN